MSISEEVGTGRTQGDVRRPASESGENNCPLFSWLSGRFSRNPYSSGRGAMEPSLRTPG